MQKTHELHYNLSITVWVSVLPFSTVTEKIIRPTVQFYLQADNITGVTKVTQIRPISYMTLHSFLALMSVYTRRKSNVAVLTAVDPTLIELDIVFPFSSLNIKHTENISSLNYTIEQ
jgi:hypothetical protein